MNRAVPLTHGETIVFSDANAIFRPDALCRLVRNFADPEVGCVAGRKAEHQPQALPARPGTTIRDRRGPFRGRRVRPPARGSRGRIAISQQRSPYSRAVSCRSHP